MARWVGEPPLSQRQPARSSHRRGHGRGILLVVLTCLALFAVIDFRLRPAIMKAAEARLRVAAIRAINMTISENIARNIRYEDLYAIRLDSRGRPVFLQPNTGEINHLSAQAALEVQEALKAIHDEHLSIPFGQILGSRLVAGLGPRIPVKVVPIGTVETTVINRFEQAGINQTWHKIYLEIKTTMEIVAPFASQGVVVKAQVPLVEGIILGEVPGVYLQGLGVGDSD